ncbi:MAG: hypothetical protein ABJF88_07930 [Rhodothermales bacterium]
MGQQQLLLLVIGVILVGLAVMAGLTAIQTHIRQDEADGLVDRSLAIATYAYYWKSRNDPFAGGDQSYENLATNGMGTLSLDTATVRGRFDITNAWPDSVEITAVSSRYPDIGVRIVVDQYNIKRTTVRFDGTFALN